MSSQKRKSQFEVQFGSTVDHLAEKKQHVICIRWTFFQFTYIRKRTKWQMAGKKKSKKNAAEVAAIRGILKQPLKPLLCWWVKKYTSQTFFFLLLTMASSFITDAFGAAEATQDLSCDVTWITAETFERNAAWRTCWLAAVMSRTINNTCFSSPSWRPLPPFTIRDQRAEKLTLHLNHMVKGQRGAQGSRQSWDVASTSDHMEMWSSRPKFLFCFADQKWLKQFKGSDLRVSNRNRCASHLKTKKKNWITDKSEKRCFDISLERKKSLTDLKSTDKPFMLFQPRRTAVTFKSMLPNYDYSCTPGYNHTCPVTVCFLLLFFHSSDKMRSD